MARFAKPARKPRATAPARRRAPSRTKAVTRYVNRYVARAAPRGSRRRRVAGAIISGGSAMTIAQAKILPGAVGGYIVSKIERGQRMKQAKGESPLIKDPTYRLVAGLGALALIASKTSGMIRDVAIGSAGSIGTLYEMYNATEGNPDDGYMKEIKEGRPGI